MANKTKRLDYIPHTNLHFYQDPQMFCMNTDTHCLINFMRIRPLDTVLDIGTNNGAILLAASLQPYGKLIGVEIQSKACALAKENMIYNKIQNVEIIEGDIKTIQLDPVDVIVCNPPYFPYVDEKKLNENEALKIARHEICLNFADCCRSVQRLLKDNGHFFFVHRANRLIELIRELDKVKLEIIRMQFVYDEDSSEGKSVLIEAAFHRKSNVLVELPIMIKR